MVRHLRSGGWAPIGAYVLLAAATQVLWLTFAAITTDSAHRYGVSEGDIGLLSEIFPLLFVLLALPGGALLDRALRPALVGAGVLVAAGGLLRLVSISYGWALAGAVVVAVAQPVVVAAIPKLAAEYLAPERRALGIGLGSAGTFLGMVVALILGPAIGAHGDLEPLLEVQAVMGVVAALAVGWGLRRPGRAPSRAPAVGIRDLWRRPLIRTLSALMFLGFGIFVALATWLQALLRPDGVSDTTAGALLVGMVLAGVVGCAAWPEPVARRGVERQFMAAVVALTATGSVLLGAVTAVAVRAGVLVVIGVVLLAALPVVLTLAERAVGEAAAASVAALVWMAGNLGGLVVALLVQALVHHPLAAFSTLAAVALLGVPLIARWPGTAPGHGASPVATQ